MLISLFLIGCSTTADFYPVKGPLNEDGKLTPLTATVRDIMGNRGRIEIISFDGEFCEGIWVSAGGSSTQTTTLFNQYGAYAGTAYTSGGNKQNPGTAIINCASGTQFQVEFVTAEGTARGFGVAKDNRGNIYKVIF